MGLRSICLTRLHIFKVAKQSDHCKAIIMIAGGFHGCGYFSHYCCYFGYFYPREDELINMH